MAFTAGFSVRSAIVAPALVNVSVVPSNAKSGRAAIAALTISSVPATDAARAAKSWPIAWASLP